MTRVLESGRRGAAAGEATALVVFLHGYGADGADLLSLAEPLAPHLPGTAFIAPDAPEMCSVNPGGRQWFPVPWIDGTTEETSEASLMRSAADLDAFLDALQADEGIGPERTVLFGFSQGTMMALHVAPRRRAPYAGLVGFSGRLLRPEMLADEVVSRMPVLLLHGDQDDVVPPDFMPEASNALTAAGFEVYAQVMEGTAHGMDQTGLEVALAFVQDRLGL